MSTREEAAAPDYRIRAHAASKAPPRVQKRPEKPRSTAQQPRKPAAKRSRGTTDDFGDLDDYNDPPAKPCTAVSASKVPCHLLSQVTQHVHQPKPQLISHGGCAPFPRLASRVCPEIMSLLCAQGEKPLPCRLETCGGSIWQRRKRERKHSMHLLHSRCMQAAVRRAGLP